MKDMPLILFINLNGQGRWLERPEITCISQSHSCCQTPEQRLSGLWEGGLFDVGKLGLSLDAQKAFRFSRKVSLLAIRGPEKLLYTQAIFPIRVLIPRWIYVQIQPSLNRGSTVASHAVAIPAIQTNQSPHRSNPGCQATTPGLWAQRVTHRMHWNNAAYRKLRRVCSDH